MGFLVFLASALVLALALRPHVLDEDGAGERAALVVLLWFGILIGANWALALPGLLTTGGLWACSAGFALGGGALLWRRRGARKQTLPASVPPLVLLVLLALGSATLYLVFRGSLVFVQEYDALTYHFPKAVEILRAHTIPRIPSGDFRVAYFPWNYELLLADGLLLTPGDGLSFLLGLMATFGFGATAFAALRRAWPELSPSDALVGVVFVAATPVLILQSADYKNDVLFSFFLLAVLHWGARWHGSGRGRELAVAGLALALCFGTKATVLFLFPVLGFALWTRRAWFAATAGAGWRRWAPAASGAAVVLILSGACWPLLNRLWCGHFLGDTALVGGMSGYEANAVPHYSGFGNLWKFPFLALIRPFSSREGAVWVFWEHRYWWWPGLHPIYSHFGWLCSALLLLLPAGILVHRSRRDEGVAYRLALTLAILAFTALSLPQRYRVDGMFCGFPRYLLCIPVVVALWTLAPGLVWLRREGRARLLGAAGVAVVAYFLGSAYVYLVHDATKPLGLVLELLRNPKARPEGGMAFAFDRLAGPGDTVAFDSGFGGTVYPLYGKDLTRPLIFLRPGPGGYRIPPEAKWVLIDRAWNVGWSHPGVTTTADFSLPLRRAPTGDDLALATQMWNDPEFVLVYNDPSSNQAAFLRRTYLGK